jgi:hypothetical protein
MTVYEEFIERMLEAHVDVVRHRDHLTELKARRPTKSIREAIPVVQFKLALAEDRVGRYRVALLLILDKEKHTNEKT